MGTRASNGDEQGWRIEPGTVVQPGDVIRFRYAAPALRRVARVEPKFGRGDGQLVHFDEPRGTFELCFASGTFPGSSNPMRGVELASSGSGIRPRVGDELYLRAPMYGLGVGCAGVLSIGRGECVLSPIGTNKHFRVPLGGLDRNMLPPGDFELRVPCAEDAPDKVVVEGLDNIRGRRLDQVIVDEVFPPTPAELERAAAIGMLERAKERIGQLAKERIGQHLLIVTLNRKPVCDAPLDPRRAHQRAVEAALVAHPSLNRQAFIAAELAYVEQEGIGKDPASILCCVVRRARSVLTRDPGAFVTRAIAAGYFAAYDGAVRRMAMPAPVGPWLARRHR